MNVTKTKINLYKFVSTTGIQAASDAKPETQATVEVQTKQVEAINQLGNVVNGIAASISKIENIEIARLKALSKKTREFEPDYTKPKKIKLNLFGKLLEAFKMPNFLKGLFDILMAFLKKLILLPVLKWLADPKNKETIIKTFQVIYKVFSAITKFVTSAFAMGITSIAKAIRGDGMSSWQRVFFFAKGILAFGAILIGLKWLNPLRIAKTMKEIGMIFKGFNVALFNFRNALRAKRGLKALKYGKGVAGTKFLRRAPGFTKGALITGGLLSVGSIIRDMNTEDKGGEEDVPERRMGGPIGKNQGMRKISKYGGMIRGPETGYPVSMDGGKTTSFIGHGTEQVSVDKKGSGYVIPINNAATRANPYLTDFNRIAAMGMGMPEMFLGGLFKGAGNLLSGKSWGGTRGVGPVASGAEYASRLSGAQTNSPSTKPGFWGQVGSFLTKGDGNISGAQMIGRALGNERAGASIGNILGIFQGGGSGPNGQATGMDIIRGVAGNFLGGTKAGGYINAALGIGDILKGEGNWASKFRDIAGQYGDTIANLIGGKTGATVGNFLDSYFNGTAGGGSIAEMLGGAASAGVGRIADAANTTTSGGYSGGMGITDPDGGMKAAKIVGKSMLDRGYTVFGHPHFRNNKFSKEIGANPKGFDPSGRQPVGGGPFHSRGLGLNIADYRPGDQGARLRNLSDFLRGQIDTFKIVQIVHDKWGMWFAGQKEKKGPSRYGYPNAIGVGIADKTPEETGVGSQQAIANNQRSIMKKALEGGDGSVGDAALNIRKVFNQASAAEGGASKSLFGGDFFLDILNKEDNKISDMFMSNSDYQKGLDAFALAQDNEGLSNFLYKKGANEDQAMNYMNLIDGDLFTKTPLFNNDDSAYSFSDTLKIGNSLYTTDDGKSATDFYAKKNAGVTDSEIKDKKKSVYSASDMRSGKAFTRQKDDSLISKANKGQSNVNRVGGGEFGAPNADSDERSKEYYQRKASRDREHAMSAMNDKIQATIQTALASVQAHNSSVQALVQSENQKVLQMQKNAKEMAAKVKRARRDRQQNQNQSAIA